MKPITTDVNELPGRRKPASAASRTNQLVEDTGYDKHEHYKPDDSQHAHGEPIVVCS